MNIESILFLTFWYPNKNNKNLGIFVKRHAHAIQLQNSIVVLSLNVIEGKGFFKRNISVFKDERGMETHQLYLESRFNKLLYLLLPLHYWILKKYIKRNLSDKGFTIIHSNIIFPCGVVGYSLAKKLKLKHVITEHWSKIHKFFSRNFYNGWAKKAMDNSIAITAVSNQLINSLKKYTINSSLYTVPNVIDSSEFYYNPIIEKSKPFTFIAAGHWGKDKNPFYFLDALQELQKEKRLLDFKVVLAGDGEQIQKIKNNKYSFEIDCKGNLSSKDLNAELNKSHIFLHGSDFETFSVIIAEALMCGLPSVVSPVGIGPEVINQSNGFVTNNTAADWQEKILACCNTSYDYARIAEQLKDRYSLETVGALFSKLYGNLP